MYRVNQYFSHMEMKHIRLIWLFFCFLIYGQANAFTDYQTYNHSSGLIVIQHSESGKSASLQFYFRIGSAYETDSTYGYSLLFSNFFYQRVMQAAPGLNVNQIIEPEMIGFTFNVEQEKLATTMALFRDVVLNYKITDNDITGLQQSSDDTLKNRFKRTVLKKLWGDDYKKVCYLTRPIYSVDKGRLESFQKLYFNTSNAVVCINAALEKLQMDVMLDKTFTQRGLAQFNPERITHVIEFKPIVNNTHFIFNNVQEKEESGIVFQNPGARYDRRGSYCAYLLNQMLENGKNEDGVNASYKSNNYFGTFTITAEVKDHKYKTTLDKLIHTIKKVQGSDFITQERLSKAKDLVINEYKNLALSGPIYFMKEMAYFRFTNDENYILSFTDSLANISEQDMKWYINDYFINRAGVMYTFSNIDAEHYADSTQRVFNLDGDFTNSKCFYELNKTDLYGDSNWTNVYRVISWLQINADAHVQINGFADQSEYNRVKDVPLQTFIDSIPTFRKAMPDFIKTGYMRPESMRSLKLMKVFYENGIDLNRITGTSMLYTSDTKEKAAENRRCTFVVEKIKPTKSLREYHYKAKN
jgi:predicted Zn-dependent peptidase